MKLQRLLAAIVFFTPSSSVFAAPVSKADSLLSIIKTASSDTGKIHALVELSHELRNSQAKEAFKYAELALKLSEKKKFDKGITDSHNELRILYYNERKYTEAFIHGKIVYDKELSGKNDFRKGKASYALGNIFYKQNNYSDALKWYLLALKYYEQAGVKYETGITQEIIGAVYLSNEELNNAKDYYEKSLNTAIEIKDSVGIASGFSNMGIVYGHQQKYKEAFEVFNKSLNLLIQLKDTIQLIQVLNNMGITYKKAGMYDDALMSYQFCGKLISYFQPIDSVALNYVNSNLGILYMKMHKNDLAKDYLNRAINYSFSEGDISLRSEAYNALYELYYNTGDFKKSLDYHLKYIEVRDSLFSADKNRQMAEMQAQYDTDEKDLKIKTLNQENKVNESELKRQRTINYSVVGGLVSILAIVLILYNRFHLKKKSNEQLELANSELHDTVLNLKETQAQLVQQEKMASLGQLTAGIAHEIKNPLNFVTNFSELSSELLEEMKTAGTDDERNEIIADLKINLQKINEHGKRADSIITSMLQHSRSGNEEKQPVDINALCDEFLNLAFHGMRATALNFNCSLKKEFSANLPRVNIIQADISRVLLNLINNAFYAVAKREEAAKQKKEVYLPQLTLTTSLAGNQVLIKVNDNGTGIPNALKEKIFNPFFTTKPSGFGTGLGLSLSFDIVKAHGGELKMTSTEGIGTEFTIALPVS